MREHGVELRHGFEVLGGHIAAAELGAERFAKLLLHVGLCASGFVHPVVLDPLR